MARKRGNSNFVRTCSQTKSTMKLNQKLNEHSQMPLDTGRKYLCKNLGVNEGEGVCSKGVYFRKLTVL